MAKRMTVCPMCKQEKLYYTETHVKCSGCEAYQKPLNFWQRLDQWAYTRSWTWRSGVFLLVLMYAVFIGALMSKHIDQILEKTLPVVYSPLVALIITINLGIHEMGHFIFAPFGATLHILGGSLMEIIFATLLVIGLLQVRYFFAASLSLVYLGFSFLSVAKYVADAWGQILNLVGPTVNPQDLVNAHDWHNLLSMYNRLHDYDEFARLLQAIGLFFMVMGIVLSFLLLLKMYKNKATDPTLRRQ